MMPSRTSIKNILLMSDCAIDFKINCKIMFGWTEKRFLSVMATNHCFHALKNNKSKEWIIENILTPPSAANRGK